MTDEEEIYDWEMKEKELLEVRDWFDNKGRIVIKNGMALRDIQQGETLISYGKRVIIGESNNQTNL